MKLPHKDFYLVLKIVYCQLAIHLSYNHAPKKHTCWWVFMYAVIKQTFTAGVFFMKSLKEMHHAGVVVRSVA
jgi:hypothetical protein